MEKLNVRFSDQQKRKISDLSDCLDLFSSDVARAAMAIGLEKLQALAARDAKEAKNQVSIYNLKSK